jgi:hypothetical protein
VIDNIRFDQPATEANPLARRLIVAILTSCLQISLSA